MGFVETDRSSLFQFSSQSKMPLTCPCVTPGFQPYPVRIQCINFVPVSNLQSGAVKGEFS